MPETLNFCCVFAQRRNPSISTVLWDKGQVKSLLFLTLERQLFKSLLSTPKCAHTHIHTPELGRGGTGLPHISLSTSVFNIILWVAWFESPPNLACRGCQILQNNCDLPKRKEKQWWHFYNQLTCQKKNQLHPSAFLLQSTLQLGK